MHAPIPSCLPNNPEHYSYLLQSHLIPAVTILQSQTAIKMKILSHATVGVTSKTKQTKKHNRKSGTSLDLCPPTLSLGELSTQNITRSVGCPQGLVYLGLPLVGFSFHLKTLENWSAPKCLRTSWYFLHSTADLLRLVNKPFNARAFLQYACPAPSLPDIPQLSCSRQAVVARWPWTPTRLR